MNVGYIRVSSLHQNTERQLHDVKLDKLFEEKASGKNQSRPVLQACLEFCREGDSLHVHSIDRLARNLKDLQEVVEQLTSKRVRVQFHKEQLVFDAMNDPIKKLMFQMMGAFAEFERNLIRERQAEGIVLAKAKGRYKQVGRKKVMTPIIIEQARLLIKQEVPISRVAKKLGVSRPTLYRALKSA